MASKNLKDSDIINAFPMKYNNIILNLLSEEIKIEYDEYGRIKERRIHLIDNEGYKYYINFYHLRSTKNSNKRLCRFFYNNIYTYENINHFCKINDVDLHIDGTGLPISGHAREKLNFTKSNGETIKLSWNQVQHYTFQYKDNYKEIKQCNWDNCHMTKEKAIPIIMDMYEKLQRPLLQCDFESVNTTDKTIGIRVIWRIWGTFTNMLKDLGLPEHDCYYRPNDKNYIPHEKIISYIDKVSEEMLKEGRNIITTKDIKNITGIEIGRIRNHFKLDDLDFDKELEKRGYKLQEHGNGMNHIFDDGERTTSKYEYDFSLFLRNNGFVFNKTYFRNIYYKKLDDKYSGNMNCDYKIIVGDKVIYIELAGILGNPEYMNAYRNNISIKSKSKEEYRLKLNQKREMFERNNLEYYILLPDEMNEETYKNILNKYLNAA